MVSLLPLDLFFLGDAIPRINDRLKDIAQKNNILYLNLYSLFIDENSRTITSYYEADGVHLSADGYEVWARALENTVFPSLN